jgi:RimJ/RimL family protein N-acetyltransferase
MLPDSFETARLVLRPVTLVDADAIFDTYAQDEEVARYVKWRPHRSRSETQTFVERCIATPADVENNGSARVLEKSGFVREGVLGRWLPHPNISDEPRDCYSYARVR